MVRADMEALPQTASSAPPPGFPPSAPPTFDAPPTASHTPAITFTPATSGAGAQTDRRLGPVGLAALVLVAVVAIVLLVPPIRNHVPFLTRDAGDVYAKIQRAGVAVTDRNPGGAFVEGALHEAGCRSSRVFTSADASRTAVGMICVGPSGRISDGLAPGSAVLPTELGAFVAQAEGGDVLLFGVGWTPQEASAIRAAAGGTAV
jgi:hypothetical protein